MVGTLEANGDNTTPLKHMGKAKLSRAGELPVSISVDQKLIQNSGIFLEHHRDVVEKVRSKDCSSKEEGCGRREGGKKIRCCLL